MQLDISGNNVMLDLETMGTGSDAAMIAIGAVRFSDKGVSERPPFYCRVDLQSCIDLGLTVDASTLMWWLRQDRDARSEVSRPAEHVATVLLRFETWIGEDAKVWGNGAAFDNVILGTAYRKFGRKQPWKFWNDRCYRTIKAMYPGIECERVGVHHNAEDDARTQAEHLVRIVRCANSQREVDVPVPDEIYGREY